MPSLKEKYYHTIFLLSDIHFSKNNDWKVIKERVTKLLTEMSQYSSGWEPNFPNEVTINKIHDLVKSLYSCSSPNINKELEEKFSAVEGLWYSN